MRARTSAQRIDDLEELVGILAIEREQLAIRVAELERLNELAREAPRRTRRAA